MAISSSNLADKVEASVIVAQDGSGDYNGTTQQCIQDAIDSISTGGGWVFIKPGTYTINEKIVTTTAYNLKISGVPGASILRAGETNTIMTLLGYMTELEGLYFNGIDATGTVGDVLTLSGRDSIIRGCQFWRFTNDIIEFAADEGLITECHFNYNVKTHIKVTGDRSMIRNCSITPGALAWGVSVTNCDYVGLIGNTLWGYYGVYTDPTSDYAVISSNRGIGLTEGIWVGGKYSVVANNTLNMNPGGTAILEGGSGDYNMIVGNIVRKNPTGIVVYGENTILGLNMEV